MTSRLDIKTSWLDSPKVISLERWLALHPGRIAVHLDRLTPDHEATIIDVWPRIAARRIIERQQASQNPIALPYNANLDVWKRPETD